MLDNLYKQYGQLMVQLEILQGRIGECKKAIADALNKGGSGGTNPANRDNNPSGDLPKADIKQGK